MTKNRRTYKISINTSKRKAVHKITNTKCFYEAHSCIRTEKNNQISWI